MKSNDRELSFWYIVVPETLKIEDEHGLACSMVAPSTASEALLTPHS